MYMQIKDAAAKLGFSRQWTHVLIDQGKLNTTMLAGRRVVIADKAFQALERGRRKVGKSEKSIA